MSDQAASLPVGAYVVRAGPGGAVLGFDELKVTMRQALEKAVDGRPALLSTVGRHGQGVSR